MCSGGLTAFGFFVVGADGARRAGGSSGDRCRRPEPMLRPTGARQSGNGWSNAFDVGHVGNSALWSVLPRKRIRSTHSSLDHLSSLRANSQHGLAVNLANARLADLEDLADLAQIELPLVVERQNEALALR